MIGITGGVGAGKSALLQYIKEKYCCKILMADEIAHKVKEPGQACYEEIVSLLSPEILEEDGTIHRGKMAVKIFGSEELLQKVNNLIHPAVKKMILDEITVAKAEGKLDFLFVEAALLIEDGYLDIVDEMWYIYAEESVRRARLEKLRGYSEEKIKQIMGQQLSEEDFRKNCDFVIDNSGSFEETRRQIYGRLYLERDRFTALLVDADYYAVEIMSYFQDKGMCIPDEMSIIGFDNNSFSRVVRPKLTTVHQDVELKAVRAMELLQEHLQNPDQSFKRITLPVRLIKRETVKNISEGN